MTGGGAVDASDLLSPVESEIFQAYHEALVSSVLRKEGALKIVPDVGGAGIGKGMVAAREYPAGTRILAEPPLVRPQHHIQHPSPAYCFVGCSEEARIVPVSSASSAESCDVSALSV